MLQKKKNVLNKIMPAQPTFTCSKSTRETLEKGMKYAQI